jgi:4-alpha-glucanotransferase
MIPLFSSPSSTSWGAGELPDLVPLSAWLTSAGFDRLMLLPIGVVAHGETSPYSATSAMAIDPIYIALDHVQEFARAGGVEALSPESRANVDLARRAATVHYAGIRLAKEEALTIAFDKFVADEWLQLTTRAAELAGYIARERWWLDDFALYQAISSAHGGSTWREWPAPVRDRDAGAIYEARRSFARQMLEQQYRQWLAETQWHRARNEAHELGVTVFGDLPFMVSEASPDVWSRPDEFMLDVSLGVPPDAFSAIGQDWGLPTYRWDQIASTGFAWIRQRARRMAALYGGYRVDHLVGLYRTFGRPPGGEPFFNPGEEPAQTAQGETILRIFLESGAAIIAEDLGVVPDFVRASLARLGVPGCKVMRWERDWHAPGHPFVDPRGYPSNSAAMTGTHDTETLAGWWETAAMDERQALCMLLLHSSAGEFEPASAWSEALHAAILRVMFQAGSDDLFLPIQDVFGWLDRINIPATVGEHNWTWKLPCAADRLNDTDFAVSAAERCSALSAAGQRAEGKGQREVGG